MPKYRWNHSFSISFSKCTIRWETRYRCNTVDLLHITHLWGKRRGLDWVKCSQVSKGTTTTCILIRQSKEFLTCSWESTTQPTIRSRSLTFKMMVTFIITQLWGCLKSQVTNGGFNTSKIVSLRYQLNFKGTSPISLLGLPIPTLTTKD